MPFFTASDDLSTFLLVYTVDPWGAWSTVFTVCVIWSKRHHWHSWEEYGENCFAGGKTAQWVWKVNVNSPDSCWYASWPGNCIQLAVLVLVTWCFTLMHYLNLTHSLRLPKITYLCLWELHFYRRYKKKMVGEMNTFILIFLVSYLFSWM